MTTSRTASGPPDLRNPIRDRRRFPLPAKKRLLTCHFIAPAMRITAIALLVLTPFSHPASALERATLSRTDAGAITLKAENSPLNGLMQELARKCGLDLNAPSLSNEGVYLDLAGGSLEDVLKKLLRGYNYVLIEGDGSGKASLTVMGKVQRVELSYPPPPAVSAPPAATSVSNPSTGETSALPVEQELAPGGGSSRPHGAGERSGEASAAAFSGGVDGGGSRAAAQSASLSGATSASTGLASSGAQSSSSSGATSAATSLVPPAPPQIAGHEPPPTIPSNLVNGNSAGQGGSGSTSGSTSGGNSSGSSGNAPPAPPPMPPMPPQIPGKT